MNTERRTVNISAMTHMRLVAYCQRHQLKVSSWVDSLIAGAVKEEQAPTSIPEPVVPISIPSGPTPSQEAIITRVKTFTPTKRQEQIMHSTCSIRPITPTIDGELSLDTEGASE